MNLNQGNPYLFVLFYLFIIFHQILDSVLLSTSIYSMPNFMAFPGFHKGRYKRKVMYTTLPQLRVHINY